MDGGSFEPSGDFSRDPFHVNGHGHGHGHGHGQSNSTQLGMGYSLMDIHLQAGPSPSSASQNSQQQLPMTSSYESHDDLCVDQCMGVGLYNGSHVFNHRGASNTMPARWPGRAPSSQNIAGALFDYPTDLGLDHNALSMQYRTSFAPSQPDTYQPYMQHHSQSSIHDCEDDCHSMADGSCCDSQCTMTGRCTNIACANKEDACTDQNCPDVRSNPVPSEVVDVAAALISINHGPEPLQHRYSLQSPASGMDFGFSRSSQQNNLGFNNWLPITNHLLAAHGDSTPADSCTNSCPLENYNIYGNCNLPINDQMNTFGQYGMVGPGVQIDNNFPVCGVEINDPQAFLQHFNQAHRQFMVASQNTAPSNFGTSQTGVSMSSTEILSPSPTTPLDTSDSGASLNTPSPLTPASQGLETPDAKNQISLHGRSVSVDSSVSLSVGMSTDDEHKCLWREDGCPGICGQVFTDSGELFDHVATAHIKNATKGTQGFRCAWDDCPRSHEGAAGFPQRSKIERHMQTHIGHKPHICPTCNKGFSAKQALNQHMFIHTEEKPLECDVCTKTFRYPSALTMHMRVHSGVKPLKCPVCDKRFSESSNLSKHKRTHEVRGRFNCNYAGCGRNFHRQDQLRRHLKTHQRENESPQVEQLANRLSSVMEGSPSS